MGTARTFLQPNASEPALWPAVRPRPALFGVGLGSAVPADACYEGSCCSPDTPRTLTTRPAIDGRPRRTGQRFGGSPSVARRLRPRPDESSEG